MKQFFFSSIIIGLKKASILQHLHILLCYCRNPAVCWDLSSLGLLSKYRYIKDISRATPAHNCFENSSLKWKTNIRIFDLVTISDLLKISLGKVFFSYELLLTGCRDCVAFNNKQTNGLCFQLHNFPFSWFIWSFKIPATIGLAKQVLI